MWGFYEDGREIMAREIKKARLRILLKSLMKCSTVLGQGL